MYRYHSNHRPVRVLNATQWQGYILKTLRIQFTNLRLPKFQQKLRAQINDKADRKGELEHNPVTTNGVEEAVSAEHVKWNLKEKEKEHNFSYNPNTRVVCC